MSLGEHKNEHVKWWETLEKRSVTRSIRCIQISERESRRERERVRESESERERERERDVKSTTSYLG